MEPQDLPPMTVVRLRIDAFKRIEAAEVTPTPTGLVLVRGRNGAGKSSTIESMIAALLGGKAAPELPITEGHGSAEVVLDLGEIVIERRWTRDSGGKAKAKLTVRGRDGSSFSSPQSVLEALVGYLADPVAFLAMSPEEQVKTVLSVLGLDAELARLEDLERGAVETRRDIKRDHKRIADAVEVLRREVAALPAAADLDVTAISDELTSANQCNAAFENTEQAINSSAERGKILAKVVDDGKARIEELEEELQDARRDLEEATQQVNDAREEYRALTKKLGNMRRIDVEPIKQRLQEARGAEQFRVKRELLASEEAKAVELAAAVETCEGEVEAARGEIAALLDRTQFPVSGMSYNADVRQLTIGGIPFSQASQAQRLAAAASVAMAGDPKIRVVFVREGSLLDDEMLAMVAEMARERGFQLWVERVDSHREGPGLYVEDGVVYENTNETNENTAAPSQPVTPDPETKERTVG